jgi:hypothetical protein
MEDGFSHEIISSPESLARESATWDGISQQYYGDNPFLGILWHKTWLAHFRALYKAACYIKVRRLCYRLLPFHQNEEAVPSVAGRRPYLPYARGIAHGVSVDRCPTGATGYRLRRGERSKGAALGRL